jgi:ABC-type multidrug transport system ATPase subunit
MVLVLGRPGAGCSSFLKTITNQRGSFAAIDGDVQYAGFGAEEFGKRYAGQTAYNMEGMQRTRLSYCFSSHLTFLVDDVHYPLLSVAQTLQFALKLKSPGRLLPEQSRAELSDEVLSTLLSMLNIAHTRNTVVGNEFVRGVSGGERKRVSIAEMMVSHLSSMLDSQLTAAARPHVPLSAPGTTPLAVLMLPLRSTTPSLCAS